MADELAAVVMAGGLGTRMKSAIPKHLHTLLGRRMVDWVICAARDAGVGRVVLVASPETRDLFDGVEVAAAATGAAEAGLVARTGPCRWKTGQKKEGRGLMGRPSAGPGGAAGEVS